MECTAAIWRGTRERTDATRMLCVRLTWRDWNTEWWRTVAIPSWCSTCSARWRRWRCLCAVLPQTTAVHRDGSGPPPRPRTCTDLQPHVTAVFQNVCYYCCYCADPVTSKYTHARGGGGVLCGQTSPPPRNI